MLTDAFVEQCARQRGLDDAAGGEGVDRRPGELRQRPVAHEPDAERQPEAVLFLGDDLVRQKSAQRLLEEVAELAPADFSSGGKPSEKSSSRSSRSGKPTSTPPSDAVPVTFGRSLSARMYFHS